jgi:hypothetical protein
MIFPSSSVYSKYMKMTQKIHTYNDMEYQAWVSKKCVNGNKEKEEIAIFLLLSFVWNVLVISAEGRKIRRKD